MDADPPLAATGDAGPAGDHVLDPAGRWSHLPAQGWDGVGYKVVAKLDARYFSVWAGVDAEYVMGMPAADEARLRHGGGLYVCKSFEAAIRHRIPARRGGLFIAPRVVLRCQCEGPFVEYPGGKVACSRLIPLEELPLPRGYLHSLPRGRRAAHPLPHRPLTPQGARSFVVGDPPAYRPATAPTMQDETQALEAEVAEMERRLGYFI